MQPLNNITKKWGRGEEKGRRQQLCKLGTGNIKKGKAWEGAKETSTLQPKAF